MDHLQLLHVGQDGSSSFSENVVVNLDPQMASHVVRAEHEPIDAGSARATIAPFHSALNGVDQPTNDLFTLASWVMLGAFGGIILTVRLMQHFRKAFRLRAGLKVREKDGTLDAFTSSTSLSGPKAFLKKHFLYAPLFTQSHNAQIQLTWKFLPANLKRFAAVVTPSGFRRFSKENRYVPGRNDSRIDAGVLPSRLHFFVLGSYILSNIVYTFHIRPNENKYAIAAEIRGRSGTLGLVNMVPLMLFATRFNPLIYFLTISFDTYNLMHRWLGRLTAAEIVLHTLAWVYVQYADGGIDSINHRLQTETFIFSGMVGTLAMVFICFFAVSPLRHTFYEIFLNLHIAFAIIIFVCTMLHCVTAEIGHLPQTSWTVAIIGMWALERVWRVANGIHRSYANPFQALGDVTAVFGKGTPGQADNRAVAFVEWQPADAVRVTVRLPGFVDIKPGSHAYLRLFGCRAYDSHPFTIAWVDYLRKKDVDSRRSENPNTVAYTHAGFVIASYDGMTRNLYDLAIKHYEKLNDLAKLDAKKYQGQLTNSLAAKTFDRDDPRVKALPLKCIFEGPYGGHHPFDSYESCLLIAGAAGITHPLSYIRPLLQGIADGVNLMQHIHLVWVVREVQTIEWIRVYMDSLFNTDFQYRYLPPKSTTGTGRTGNSNSKDDRYMKLSTHLKISVYVTQKKEAPFIAEHQMLRNASPADVDCVKFTFGMRPDFDLILGESKKYLRDHGLRTCAVTVCAGGPVSDSVRKSVCKTQESPYAIDYYEESFSW